MRYLVFGDVHANLVGLEAVLAAGERRQVDAYLSVGDLVGYGPSPLECLERLLALYRDQRFAWVAGNHDLAARGDAESGHFSQEATETLAWTRRVLADAPWACEFLATGPLISKISGGIWLTHDSLEQPGSGRYHRQTENAQAELSSLAGRGGRIAFYGHTHTLRAEVLAGDSVMLTPMTPCPTDAVDARPLRLGGKERAWVGTGSAGFPTRRKGAAEFLVLSDETWTVEKYAVEFSREKARERVQTVLGPECAKEVVERIVRWL